MYYGFEYTSRLVTNVLVYKQSSCDPGSVKAGDWEEDHFASIFTMVFASSSHSESKGKLVIS